MISIKKITETKVEVKWTNVAVTPSSRSDWISVAYASSKDSEWITYSYNKSGSTSGSISIDVPDSNANKEYVVRYVAADGKILAESLPFKFLIKKVSNGKGLLRPLKRIAGNKLEIEYRDFDSTSTSDWIALCVHGSQASDYITYSYIRDGSSSKMIIDCSGHVDDGLKVFVLRYFNSRNKPVCESESFRWSSIPQSTTNMTTSKVTLSSTSTLHVSSGRGHRKLTIQWSLSNRNSTTSDYISLSEMGSQSSDYVTYTYVKSGSSSSGVTELDCTGYADDDSKMFVARYFDSSDKVVAESKPFSWSTWTVSSAIAKDSTPLVKTPTERLKDAHQLLMQGLITQTDYDNLKSEVLGVKIETSIVPLAHALQSVDIEEDDDIYDDNGIPLMSSSKCDEDSQIHDDAPLMSSSKIAYDDDTNDDEMDPNGGNSNEPDLFSFWIVGADHTRSYGKKPTETICRFPDQTFITYEQEIRTDCTSGSGIDIWHIQAGMMASHI